jgi:hypothetical protein
MKRLVTIALLLLFPISIPAATPKADVSVTNVACSSERSYQLRFQYDLVNKGDKASRSILPLIYLSRDRRLDDNDFIVKTFTYIDELLPKQIYTKPGSMTYSAGTGPECDDYYVIVSIVSPGFNKDNNSNNTKASDDTVYICSY